METENLIPVEQFCTLYKIEFSFMNTLQDFGLIEITTFAETQYISKDNIRDVEKLIRMHYDLDINMEGIDAIAHLLQRVDTLQAELNALRNRLRFYEDM